MVRLAAALVLLLAAPAFAASSPPAEGHAVTARLIAAEDAVSGRTLSAGLDLRLREGWKTYWRSPGEVGLPPRIDWAASRNVADVALAFPAPERFSAFEIENYGYGGEVVFPLAVTVADPALPVHLALRAELLVCAELCVPDTVELALDLPAGGGGVDEAAAARLAEWTRRVPGTEGFRLDAVHLDEGALTLRATADAALGEVAVFPEHGPYAAFGAPEIALGADGRTLWARLPVLAAGEGPLDLTLVAGDGRAATLRAGPLALAAPAPPGPGGGLWGALVAAFLGGVILNAMPCVLPVLSIKLAAALEARDRAPGRVRAGFLAAAGGILVFFALLAVAVVALRGAGVALGWGMQFQQPAFLGAMVLLMTLFAANLWGLFEVALPGGAQTAMGRAGGGGLWGDAATGLFAALMATPCSAPFLGTAVAFALTRGAAETAAVFLVMGLGLAVPYLALAARPSLVRRLPRPGRWMAAVKAGLGGLVALAALWLLAVLWAAAGPAPAGAVAAVAAALVVGLALWCGPSWSVAQRSRQADHDIIADRCERFPR